MFPGTYSVFEYQFWKHQYRDPGTMDFARRVYEDTISHKVMETCGCMQDGSVKSFFPNGFAEYIYAETLIHRDLDYEKALHDYYTALYGEEADAVLSYLTDITKAFAFAEPLVLCALLLAVTAFLVGGSFNPFLYFRF